MLRALTPEIRANSSNRYSANAMHPDSATGALRLCTATTHATTLAVKRCLRAKSRIAHSYLLANRGMRLYLGISNILKRRSDNGVQVQPTRLRRFGGPLSE